jgi:hypothetical protein
MEMEKRLPLWRVAANILNKLNKQSTKDDKVWSSNLEVGEVVTTPHLKN